MIDKLIRDIQFKIQNKELALFCGAGISFHSGIPLVNGLLKYILEVLDVKDSDFPRILNSDLPFEAFIQTLSSEEDINDILDIFSKGEPNVNHKFIALLIKAGYLKTVFTTNFDSLIEGALNSFGLKIGIDYFVFSSEDEFGKIDWNDNLVKIIKIHGCISKREEMAITLDLVAKQTINQGKSKAVKSFFSNNINHNIFILGYSCSDLFDLIPLIEGVEKERSHVFFLEHCFDNSLYRIEDIRQKEEKNPFFNYEGIRIYYDTDFLIKKLWKLFSFPCYEYRLDSINWKENIDLWINRAVNYSEGIKKQMAARLFYNIGEFNIAIETWEQGLMIAQHEGNPDLFYTQLGNLGMSFNAIGKYHEAQTCLAESLKACRDTGNIQGEISQLQALGNVYRNLRKFDEAIKSFKRAVCLSETYINESLCSALGSLATVYNHTENYVESISILQKGLTIARSTGNKQSEGSMLSSLGIAFFQKGDHTEARDFILKSIQITRQIGDRRGECVALHNLSNLSLQFGDFDNCIKYSKESLLIAKEIRTRPNEANAYFNIGSAYFSKGEYGDAVTNLELAIEIFTDIFGSDYLFTVLAKESLTQAMSYLNS